VAGFTVSNVSPDAESTHSPLISILRLSEPATRSMCGASKAGVIGDLLVAGAPEVGAVTRGAS
jgi:hypothetical protein